MSVGACGQGLTEDLVQRALPLRFDKLPADVRLVARDCLVDWLACTFPGLLEPVSRIVAETAQTEGGHPQATFIGRASKGSALQAALVNGTTSHALDYDDVNLSVPGHLSVAIIPSLLALAEEGRASGPEFIAAFVAGYETACRIGKLVEPSHYANGFHATATIGALGAAMACAHLLKLASNQACHALGIAATQSAGLKAMFGTMAKPLHAGLAAQAGLRSAVLAQKGLTSRTDVIECTQGFARVHGADFRVADALATPDRGFHILGNLFKYHAACYSTHSTIDAISTLRRENSLDARSVSKINIVAGDGCSICNIQAPVTSLEAKFSLKAAAAFALLGIDTASLDAWDRVTDQDVVAVRDRVHVKLIPSMGLTDAEVTLHMFNGDQLRLANDCGAPIDDKVAQSQRVFHKYRAIVSPILGVEKSEPILALVENIGEWVDFNPFMELCGEGFLAGNS